MPAVATMYEKEALAALAYELAEQEIEESKPTAHHILYKQGWRPKLNPIQQMAVDDIAIYKLYCGERFSGKTYGGLHELVEFCYRNENVLAYIIVKEVGIGTEGGSWDKLRYRVLPEWNRGLGIEYTESKLDPQTKKPYIWISNRHGGWSMIMLASLPVAAHVEMKIRGREPQIILVDEAQFLETDTYFTSLLMQLGRRNTKNSDDSKIIFCCNPEGPSHWLYKRFFVDPVDETTGAWDPRYCHWHIPVSDNMANLPENYYQNYVIPAVKNDPIAEARLVRGEWVDRPDGDSLFGGAFSEAIHMRGDANAGQGLLPVVGHPMIISYDLGAAHSTVHFTQIIPTLDKIYFLVIDEIDRVGEYTPYRIIVQTIHLRMDYWEKKMKCEFHWEHISDEAAFNQYRPASGSFDNFDVMKISKEYCERNGLGQRYIIKMKACPKAEHSIEARVRMVTDGLIEQSILVSAMCQKTKEMFNRLQGDPENKLKLKKKSRYSHNFDSLSYGWFYYYTKRISHPGSVGKVQPKVYPIEA